MGLAGGSSFFFFLYRIVMIFVIKLIPEFYGPSITRALTAPQARLLVGDGQGTAVALQWRGKKTLYPVLCCDCGLALELVHILRAYDQKG